MSRRPVPAVLIRVGSALLFLVAACKGGDDPTLRLPAESANRPVADGPPVALNPNSPVEYPAALVAQGIEGTVVLQLFVDEKGTVQADSSRVAESSGYPALDSAAMVAAPKLRFAPALHNGQPVAAHFMQPVQFRHPRNAGRNP